MMPGIAIERLKPPVIKDEQFDAMRPWPLDSDSSSINRGSRV